jgi:uncharacterized membrane protein YgcG
MKNATRGIILVLVAVLSTSMLLAAPPDERPGKVRGEVVEVRQTTQLQNQGEMTEIRVRTRNQEQLWLRLGPQAEFGDQVVVGDRIRARVMYKGGDGGQTTALVECMYNYQTRTRLQVRNETGELVPLQSRVRTRNQAQDGTGDGTGQQVRTRTGRESQNGGGGGNHGGNGNGGGGGNGGRGGR